MANKQNHPVIDVSNECVDVFNSYLKIEGDNYTFGIHTALLRNVTSIKQLQAALANGWNVEVVKSFLHWLYWKTFVGTQDFITYAQLIELYLFGQQLASPLLRDAVITKLGEYGSKKLLVPTGLSKKIYAATPVDSPLRKIWVELYARILNSKQIAGEEKSTQGDKKPDNEFRKDLIIRQTQIREQNEGSIDLAETEQNPFSQKALLNLGFFINKPALIMHKREFQAQHLNAPYAKMSLRLEKEIEEKAALEKQNSVLEEEVKILQAQVTRLIRKRKRAPDE
ncbi:MAG: hypothetical protein M1834_003945 [Cirrosporium novae-zelandiae]|nr:MAG: hypothetical protein M1834_003945 [Cirrosporium novae-zelandiae]